MANFLGNFGHSIGQTLGNSISHSLGQSLNNSAPEELRVGSNYVVVREKVAEGGFGVIELVVDTHTQQREMILKRCNVDRPEVFDIVKKEVSILQKFKGPYIVSLIDNDVAMRNSSREAYILLEYCPGGHLLHRLNDRHGQFLPAESIYRIFGQILLGMKGLHESRPPIIHRDIKLENILFGTDGKVRLCDFGSCLESPIFLRNVEERNKAEESIAKETTQMYRAPEMVDLYMRNELTEKSDIWALGCVFFAISFLKHPFQDAGSLGILAGKYTIPSNGPISEDAITVMKRMLDIDPEARPSILDLLLAMREISHGAPLPHWELSAEAVQRRAQRLAADEVRKTKSKKKVTSTPIDTKRSAPPSANSVAAKRLAAKRGVSVSDTTAPSSNQFAPASSFQDDLFGAQEANGVDFGSARGSDIALETTDFDPFDVTPTERNSQGGGFDDHWGDASAPRTSSSTLRKPSFSTDDVDTFAPSVSNTAAVVTTVTEFDPFADNNTSVNDPSASSASFDPFTESSHFSATASTAANQSVFHDDDFAPTKPAPSVASSLFKEVSDAPAAPPANLTPASKPSRPSFSATDATSDTNGFDMFDNSFPSTPAPPAISAVPTTSTPAKQTIASNEDDFFAPSTPAAAAPTVLVTILPNPASAVRKPSGTSFDPFSSSHDQNFAPTTSTSSSSQHNSARNSFSAQQQQPATAAAVTTNRSSHSAHHLQDLIFAADSAITPTPETTTTQPESTIFDALPTTPLEPVRVAPVTHDLLEMPIDQHHHHHQHHPSHTPTGKSSLAPADLLSLYDMPPKSEAPLQPMRLNSAPMLGFGGDVLPPPQALGYVPHRSGGLGGGRAMPTVPVNMVNMNMNYPPSGGMRPMTGAGPGMTGSAMGAAGRSPALMIGMGNTNPYPVPGQMRSNNGDPFDSLNQFKK